MSIAIVHELRKARGTNKKLQILLKYKNHYQWQRILRAMYDTGINYHVSAPSDNTFKDDHEVDYEEMLLALGSLAGRAYTGNKARDFAIRCSREYGEMFRLILGGSLKAGVSTTTINKAYPGLIPTYPLMLAKDIKIPKYPILGSTKFDGVRLIAKNYGNRVEIITRQGKVFPLRSLQEEVSRLYPGVYDGELVIGDGLQAGRTKITGYVNRVLLGNATSIPEYTFCIFDYIPLEDWDAQESLKPFNTRYTDLASQMPYTGRVGNIRLVKQEYLLNDREVESLFNDRLEKGFEGIILRYENDNYVWKRSEALIKKKAINDCKLRCVGVTAGTGKYEGLIGALICEGKVQGKDIKVKLGSGLTDHDRYEPPEAYTGQIIDVEYNDIIKPANKDQYSLFLPRFKRVIRQ